MIKFEFGVRYLSQLKRIRPNEIGRLEASARDALRDSGGVVSKEAGVLAAEFEESPPGFWLDLAIALSGVAEAIERTGKDLFGRACLVRRDPPDDGGGPALCRGLSKRENPTGIWCDAETAAALSPYAAFRADGELSALEAFTLFDRRTQGALDFWYRPALADALLSFRLSDPAEPKCAVALEGAPLAGKRQTLRAVLRRQGAAVSVLRVSFGETERNLACVADAFWEAAQSDKPRPAAAAAVSARRLSLEIPAATREAFAAYAVSFVDAWLKAAEASKIPVFVVENVHLADADARTLLRTALGERVREGRAHLVVTGTGDEAFRDLIVGRFRVVRVVAPERREWEAPAAAIRSAFGLPPADDELLDRCLSAAADRGIAAGYRIAVGWKQHASGLPSSVHPRLSRDLLEIAYALSLSRELFGRSDYRQMFQAAGKPRAALPLALAYLTEFGVIDDPDDPRPAIPRFADFAEKTLGGRSLVVRELARGRLSEAVAGKRLLNSYESTAAFVRLGGESDENRVLDAVMDGVVGGESRAAELALADSSFGDVVGTRRAAALADLIRTRKALVFGSEADARAAFSKPSADAAEAPRYRAYALLDRASFVLSSDTLDEALLAQAAGAAKSALLLMQDRPSEKGLARAYRLLGETELARERISEAVDYFGFAAESAEKSDEQYEALLSSVNGACTQFLLGNLSRALRGAERAEQQARELYQDEWLRWAVFMRGRILFETGAYESAAALFDSVGSGEAGAEIFRDWKERSLAFCDAPPIRQVESESADGLFFRLEAAFLRGGYESAVLLADEYLEAPIPTRFRNPERVDWSSGFSLVEDRAIGRNGADRVPVRLAAAYRSLALSRLDRKEDAVAALQSLVREKPISELDPYDAFYFWALSSALQAAGAPEVDWHTVLSLAFKRLQRRASRIDDIEAKRSYLKENRWNGALYADAKAINLI